MSIFLLFILSCFSMFSPLHADGTAFSELDISKENLDLYLLIGQSNMAGRAPFSEAEAMVIPRCYLLNENNAWEPAQNPLNRYSTIRKSLGMQKMNPGYMFATTLLEKNPRRSIGLVVNARGGSSITEWEKGSAFYNEALSRIKIALKRGTLRGILWHQGESDSHDDHYIDKLQSLVTHLRNDLSDPTLPFVAGQVFYHPENKPNTRLINDQIATLPERLPFTGFVSSEGLTTLDFTHFDTESMKDLGQRYAEAMWTLINARTPKE